MYIFWCVRLEDELEGFIAYSKKMMRMVIELGIFLGNWGKICILGVWGRWGLKYNWGVWWDSYIKWCCLVVGEERG